IAGEVDDGVGVQLGDAVAELAALFFEGAIEDDGLDAGPGVVFAIGAAQGAGGAEDFKSGVREHGGEIGNDVASAANDCNAHSSMMREAGLAQQQLRILQCACNVFQASEHGSPSVSGGRGNAAGRRGARNGSADTPAQNRAYGNYMGVQAGGRGE